jgi:hypothetical protein
MKTALFHVVIILVAAWILTTIYQGMQAAEHKLDQALERATGVK